MKKKLDMKCKLNYQFPQEIFIGYCYIEKFCSSQKFSLKNKIWVIFKKILEFVSDLFWSKISWYCNLLGSGGYINRKLLTNIRQSEFPDFYYGYISFILTKKAFFRQGILFLYRLLFKVLNVAVET